MADPTTGKTATPGAKKAAPKPRAKKTNGAASSPRTKEAKQRFAKALDEAKAGAAALGSEARVRADGYASQAKAKSGDWVDDAKTYGAQAKVKGKELAGQGKDKASDAIASLGKVVSENAHEIDERFGTQYGDYARTASRSLQETAAKIDAKSVDELGEDARQFVRKSPGLAVGLAAVAGYMIARMFRRG
jgi:hypothetical protein